MGCKPKTLSDGYKVCLLKGLKYSYSYCYPETSTNLYDDANYKETLYTIDALTGLVYPKLADGCLQFEAAFVSTI